MEETKEQNKEQKECLFSLAKINSYYLFPFLAPIFCCSANYFIHSIQNENNNMELQCLLTIYIDFTYLCGGLLYFFSSIRKKTEETRDKEIVYRGRATSAVKYIFNDASQKNKIKKLLLLILISILISLSTISNLYLSKYTLFEKRLYFLFFIAILSKYILENDIYKHQILSMCIAFIGLILLFIPVLLKIQIEDIFGNIVNFLSAFAYSLFLVLIRYLTHNYYFSPLLCLLFIGIFSSIFSFIGFSIYSLIEYHDFSVIKNSFDFSQNKMGIKFYIYLIAGLFFGTGLQIFTNFVIYYFNPILLTVTDSISPMLSWILTILQDGPDKEGNFNLAIKSTGFFIQLVAGLIYNEIIICNFCGFNTYTKKCLQERQNEELISLKLSESSCQSEKNDGIKENENENDTSFNSDNEDNNSD